MQQRLVSADKSLEVTIGPGGVEVVILGHRWEWIDDHFFGLAPAGGYAEPGSGHLAGAASPEDCPGCCEFWKPLTTGSRPTLPANRTA